jgi:hypothetical protein
MNEMRDRAYRDFPAWAVDAVVRIYDRRPGGQDTVDYKAIAEILDQFPDASLEASLNLENFAATITR